MEPSSSTPEQAFLDQLRCRRADLLESISGGPSDNNCEVSACWSSSDERLGRLSTVDRP